MTQQRTVVAPYGTQSVFMVRYFLVLKTCVSNYDSKRATKITLLMLMKMTKATVNLTRLSFILHTIVAS